MTNVRYLAPRDHRVVAYGAVTGNRYEWFGGQGVYVADEDANELLERRTQQGGCCGNPKVWRPIFEVVP